METPIERLAKVSEIQMTHFMCVGVDDLGVQVFACAVGTGRRWTELASAINREFEIVERHKDFNVMHRKGKR